MSFNDIIGIWLGRVGVDNTRLPARTSKLFAVPDTSKRFQEDPAFLRDRGESAIGAGIRNSCWVPGHSTPVVNFGKFRCYNVDAASPIQRILYALFKSIRKVPSGIHKQRQSGSSIRHIKMRNPPTNTAVCWESGRTRKSMAFPCICFSFLARKMPQEVTRLSTSSVYLQQLPDSVFHSGM